MLAVCRDTFPQSIYTTSIGKVSELTRPVIFDSLGDLDLGAHQERTVLSDRFVKWLTAHYEQNAVFECFDINVFTIAFEERKLIRWEFFAAI